MGYTGRNIKDELPRRPQRHTCKLPVWSTLFVSVGDIWECDHCHMEWVWSVVDGEFWDRRWAVHRMAPEHVNPYPQLKK